MTTIIRPNAEPAATTVAIGDIFLIDGATGVRALAASVVPIRDANLNVALNNVIAGFTTTATAAGTTILTAVSTWAQYFTGVTTQIITLPVTSTLALNHSFYIQNSSTGALTVNSSGGNLLVTIGPGASALVTCIAITGTTAASWSAKYHGALVASGKVLTVNNSLTLAGTDATVMTFPTTSATLARTDAANTFTGTQTIGALVATTVNGNTVTAGTGILTLAAAKTLTANSSLTLAGTDGTVMTFPTTSATLARTDAANTFTGTQTTGGLLANSASSGVGYTTGAGGAVTQLTSRSTGVTLNTLTGAITLFAAAGTTTNTNFTVTNSSVAAADVVHVTVKSGASNVYFTSVSTTAAGSFQISFYAIAGTASDTPVFSFVVVKGAIS